MLLAVAGISIWANVGLAADVAAWQGAPRWQGIAVAVVAAWIFAGWRGGARWLGVLWLAGLVGMGATMFELAREAGAGPLAAWERVASQSAFRFHAASSWVTTGQALGGTGARVPMVFAEEHRVTAPSGGRLRGRSADGGRVTEREWTLAPGQSVTLRAGDRLEEGTALPRASNRASACRARRRRARRGQGGRARTAGRGSGSASRWWWVAWACSAGARGGQ